MAGRADHIAELAPGHLCAMIAAMEMDSHLKGRNTFLGNIPLKCQRCGNTSPTMGVRPHGNTEGYARP